MSHDLAPQRSENEGLALQQIILPSSEYNGSIFEHHDSFAVLLVIFDISLEDEFVCLNHFEVGNAVFFLVILYFGLVPF